MRRPYLAEMVRLACRLAGVEPYSVPARGGTDGSRLSEPGLPTTAVCTGMQEIHVPLEWFSQKDMAEATEGCFRIVQPSRSEGAGGRRTTASPQETW